MGADFVDEMDKDKTFIRDTRQEYPWLPGGEAVAGCFLPLHVYFLEARMSHISS
jgi:hypothetical protein